MKNLKPFDLKEALAGRAVMLRNGQRAYVRHHETELPTVKNECLTGFLQSGAQRSWRKDGGHYISDEPSGYDIIGMLPETRTINGFEVTSPETQAPEMGAAYYFPVLNFVGLHSKDSWYNQKDEIKFRLERGLVFLCADDAIANAKAMLGIDPYSDAVGPDGQECED